MLALYFDMTAMPNPVDQMRALEAAQKFIRTQMTESDLVAILRYQGSSVDVLQDFSDDRNRLLSILETMVVGEGQQERRRRTMPAAPIQARPLDRMTVSSIFLRLTGNWLPCRRRRRCLAG